MAWHTMRWDLLRPGIQAKRANGINALEKKRSIQHGFQGRLREYGRLLFFPRESERIIEVCMHARVGRGSPLLWFPSPSSAFLLLIAVGRKLLLPRACYVDRSEKRIIMDFPSDGAKGNPDVLPAFFLSFLFYMRGFALLLLTAAHFSKIHLDCEGPYIYFTC